MINVFKIIFHMIVKYFLIDFLFVCLVLFFPENTSHFLQWLLSILTRMIEAPFFEKFALDSFAFILFCITWTVRKKRLFNEGLINGPLSHKQILGRLFIILTVLAMYIDKHILNNTAPSQVSVIADKGNLFFELLLCWVVAMIVVEIFNGIIFKLFKL